MFEREKLLGDTRTSIPLATRLGNHIENHIGVPPSARAIAVRNDIRQKHPHWIERRSPTGVYNCAGLVWASRRTSIETQAAWHQIRLEDGYRILATGEEPRVGDIAAYRDGDVLLHFGFVVGFERPIAAGGRQIPTVLSKWDDMSGEFLHLVADVPLEKFNVTIDYWTDRS